MEYQYIAHPTFFFFVCLGTSRRKIHVESLTLRINTSVLSSSALEKYVLSKYFS